MEGKSLLWELPELRYADSYSRMGAIVALCPFIDRERRIPAMADWYATLGDGWTCCDNIAEYTPFLRQTLRMAERPLLDNMMRPEERAALAALPARIPVYRGCYGFNAAGLSWSLDRDTAERFTTLHRYRTPGHQRLLIEGTVARHRAVLKLDRNEAEIIAATVRVKARHALPDIEG